MKDIIDFKDYAELKQNLEKLPKEEQRKYLKNQIS